MQASELAALSEILSGVIRKALAKAKEELREEFKREIEARIAVLPVAQNGKDAEPVDLDEVVTQVLGKLPTPKDGKDGQDGKSVDVDLLRAEVLELLPIPKDGKDGEKGRDGKDADPEFIKSLVSAAWAAMPIPKDGNNGRDGIDGKDGRDGKDGIDGKDGADGLRGKDADPVDIPLLVAEIRSQIPIPKNGKDGKDADFEAVKELVFSTVQKAVDSLPKPKDGSPGKDAEPIHPDTVRLMVVDEVQKAVGTIRLPKDGEKGEPGRDALQIDILPSINVNKSYPPSTYGKHRGSTWKSLKTTTAGEFSLEEWFPITDGITNVDIVQSADLRSFTFSFELGGEIQKREFSLPVVLDRGVFKDGEEYLRGDGVTRGGNWWLCVVDRTKAVPADSNNDWRLAVRRGAEGKPGKDFQPPAEPKVVRIGNPNGKL